jgi:hypothetical protein
MTTSTTTAGTTMRAIIQERTNPKGSGISLGAPDRRHPRG